jgi:hypothetical protein
MISGVLVKSLLTAFVRYLLDNAMSKPTRRTFCAIPDVSLTQVS